MLLKFSDYRKKLQEYCAGHDLDYNKVRLGASCGADTIFVQAIIPKDERELFPDGKLVETPAPVVMIIHVNGETVSFEETKLTKEYLGM